MQLSDLSDKQLNSFIQNYRERGQTEGGKFPLSALLLEKLRRVPSPFPPVETANAIVQLSGRSQDGLVTYKEIWEVFCPEKKWVGNAPRAQMAKALARVIVHCVDNGLPILTTLVVRANSRGHSDEAVINIYEEAKSLGLPVGIDPKNFVAEQQAMARQLVLAER